MREAIEKVIAELEENFRVCAEYGSYDRADAFETAINMLKAVLNDETRDTRDSAEC